MATGRRAFEAPTKMEAMMAVMKQDPSPPSKAAPVSLPLERIILKCLEKKPGQRPQNMEDVRRDLQRLSDAQARGVSRTAVFIAAAAAVLLVMAAGIAWFFSDWRQTHRPRTNIIPVTTYPGQEIEPAISPDGTRVAFIWDGEDGNQLDLYVKPVEGGDPIRLTNTPELEGIPVWSPDGAQIAFLRRQKSGLFDVLIIPANGGAERKVAVAGRGLDWSPDGGSLVIMEPEPDKPRGLLLLNLTTGETRRLTTAPAGVQADRSPRFSPDGQSVAFSRTGTDNQSTIFVVPVGGGEPREVFHEKRGTLGLDWTDDGKEIVFAWASVPAQPSLYRVPVSGGVPEPILSQAYHPAVARHANRMAFQQTIHTQNIWRVERPGPLEGKAGAARARPVISSSQINTDMQYSPDGAKIAFLSERNGNAEIWLADADGRHEVQVTSGMARACGSPRFSPDGTQLVFDCHEGVQTDIYTCSVKGGAPRQLTSDHGSFVPGWTRDGRWIYYTSDSGRDHEGDQIWRIPSNGGTPQQITKNGGYEAQESIGGGRLYYTRKPTGDDGLWTVPLEGGAETQVAGIPNNLYRRNWDVASTGVVYVRQQDDVVRFFDFATGKSVAVFPLEKVLPVYNRNLAISPDGRWILWSQVDVDSRDIGVINGFR
jgi:Tol biopolymer transport system component